MVLRVLRVPSFSSSLRAFAPSALSRQSDPTPSLSSREELLDQIAGQIVRRGLATPAVFFLELNRPLTFLAGQATHAFFPFLAPLCGMETARQLAVLLEDPANVDRLLERIERLDREGAS